MITTNIMNWSNKTNTFSNKIKLNVSVWLHYYDTCVDLILRRWRSYMRLLCRLTRKKYLEFYFYSNSHRQKLEYFRVSKLAPTFWSGRINFSTHERLWIYTLMLDTCLVCLYACSRCGSQGKRDKIDEK